MGLISNPNNITSKYYDLVSLPLKSIEVTDEEISLINRLTEPGSNILDVGAGTGRHSIPLAKLGFNVTALDSSSLMLNEINKNYTNDNLLIVNKSIFNFAPQEKFNLIILLWNSFNEIALTKKDVLSLLKRLKELLVQDGKILINIDNAELVNPTRFDFTTEKTLGEITYKMHWSTYKYLSKTNTSISKEEVEVYRNSKLIDKKLTFIKQRYWRLEEIKNMAKIYNLKLENQSLRTSNELYLIVSK